MAKILMSKKIKFEPELDEFIFTSWSFNDELLNFRNSNAKDLADHDKCNRCGVWVKTKCVGVSEGFVSISTWQCPNCGAVDDYL